MNAAAARIDVVQRSPEWFAVRCGKLTGTAAADMLTTIKSGESAKRRDLRLRLVVERLTNRPQDTNGYINDDMRWGLQWEADARRAYEAQSGNVVEQIGFLAHRELPVGCSLDGAVSAGVGIIEIKCPRSAQHLRSLRAGHSVLPEYLPQVYHNLWVSGALWCDFVSFDPRFPLPLRLAIVRMTMPETERYAYELAVRCFLNEVDAELAEVQNLLQAKAVTR